MGQFVEILFYVGALQGVLLTFFLFSIKANKISNRLLGLLTFCWALLLLQFPMQAHGLYRDHPHLLKTISPILFVLFPLLYLHVKYLLVYYRKFQRRDLLHLLPFVINIILFIDFYMMDSDMKLELMRNKTPYYKILQVLGDEIIAAQGIIYSILILKRLARYKREIENYQSNVDKVVIKTLFIGVILIFISWIIGTIGVNLDIFNIPVNVDLFVAVYLILVIVIYFISYVAIKTPEVFKLDERKMRMVFLRNDDITIEEQKPEIKGVNPELEAVNNQLVTFMEEEKPYLNPDLGLLELAEKINVSRHQLSNVINQNNQKNFYEFINSYRTEEVKRLMQDPANKHLKLISLAYDAGFNSKASFNRIFKQMTSMTPSKYFSMQETG
jgi:AraC-like DNA-binding protein